MLARYSLRSRRSPATALHLGLDSMATRPIGTDGPRVWRGVDCAAWVARRSSRSATALRATSPRSRSGSSKGRKLRRESAAEWATRSQMRRWSPPQTRPRSRSTTAHRIERSLRARTGAQTVTLLGYAGDYSGYYTTEEEFRAQQYEGASTLLGRNASRHLQARMEKLATQPAPAPIAASNVVFNRGPQVGRFHPEDNTIASAHASVPALTRTGPRLEIRWQIRADVRVRFAEVGWFARLEQDSGGGHWTPVRVDA